jgi:hypothetical protein
LMASWGTMLQNNRLGPCCGLVASCPIGNIWVVKSNPDRVWASSLGIIKMSLSLFLKIGISELWCYLGMKKVISMLVCMFT